MGTLAEELQKLRVEKNTEYDRWYARNKNQIYMPNKHEYRYGLASVGSYHSGMDIHSVIAYDGRGYQVSEVPEVLDLLLERNEKDLFQWALEMLAEPDSLYFQYGGPTLDGAGILAKFQQRPDRNLSRVPRCPQGKMVFPDHKSYTWFNEAWQRNEIAPGEVGCPPDADFWTVARAMFSTD